VWGDTSTAFDAELPLAAVGLGMDRETGEALIDEQIATRLACIGL
jgi:hypothetical protein